MFGMVYDLVVMLSTFAMTFYFVHNHLKMIAGYNKWLLFSWNIQATIRAYRSYLRVIGTKETVVMTYIRLLND